MPATQWPFILLLGDSQTQVGTNTTVPVAWPRYLAAWKRSSVGGILRGRLLGLHPV